MLPDSQRKAVDGRLALRFDRAAGGATVLRVAEQRPPLQVVRAFPLDDGGALVHLHNLSGGVLGGDALCLSVEAGPGAIAQITSTGATRLYRSRSRAPAARQVNDVRVSEGALVEYLPDPLIPFAGSRYRQQSRIELASGAGLVWWETLAPGREARGELFGYELLEIALELEAAGRPLAVERMRIEPAARPPASAVRLGPYRYLATMYVCRVGVEPSRWLDLERRLAEMAGQRTRAPEVSWGVSALAAHGVVVRGASVAGREMTAGLLEFWREARREIWGREAVPPRKIS